MTSTDDAPVVPPRQETSETKALFNGKDLDGWIGHARHWSVKDGVIDGKNTVPQEVHLTDLKFEMFPQDDRLLTVKP
jgi:hypothetical protein